MDNVSVKAAKDLPAQGVQKPPHRVEEKRFPVYSWLLLLQWWRYSRSENETHLVVAGPPDWVVAGMAAAPGPGGLPRYCGLPGVASTAMHTLMWLTAMISHDMSWRVKAWGPQRRTM